MGKLVETVLNDLQTEKWNEDTQWSVVIAGDLLAKVHAKSYHSGFADVDAEQVTEAESKQIEQALLNLLAHVSEPRAVGAILYHLGKSNNPNHKELYIQHLKAALENMLAYSADVHNILFSLDRAGEKVFEEDAEGNSSQSVDEVEKNIRQARNYLSGFGILIPW